MKRTPDTGAVCSEKVTKAKPVEALQSLTAKKALLSSLFRIPKSASLTFPVLPSRGHRPPVWRVCEAGHSTRVVTLLLKDVGLAAPLPDKELAPGNRVIEYSVIGQILKIMLVLERKKSF